MQKLILRIRLSLFGSACFLVPYITPLSALRKRNFSITACNEYFEKLESDSPSHKAEGNRAAQLTHSQHGQTPKLLMQPSKVGGSAAHGLLGGLFVGDEV
jgi:hypothetical protein